jgi:lipopolysaccharide transport system ATP-binding protein
MGIPIKKIKSKLKDIIKFAELEEFADQPIRTYSSGMLARLGFAIVTQLDPEILLIDEVLAVGDIKFRQKCIDLMLNYKQRGVTIILVSHNVEDIKLITDRVIWLENHRIKMDGPTHLVLPKYIETMEG